MAQSKGTRKGGKGKKHRKHGRWSRAPSMKMYVATNRCAINKAKRATRHAKRVAKQRKRKEVSHT